MNLITFYQMKGNYCSKLNEIVFLHLSLTPYVFLRLMQQYSRGNNSTQSNSLKDMLQNKIDDMEKQVLSRVNTLEESKPGQKNETDQRNRVESTLTSLHHRISDLEKGASGFTLRTGPSPEPEFFSRF